MAKKMKSALKRLPTPQNDDEASAYIDRLGALDRELARREADMNGALANIKQQCQWAAAPAMVERAALADAVERYCAAHRARLTGDGKTKTYRFATGDVAWRNRPPKVTLRGKAEKVIAAIQAGPKRWSTWFLRRKIEIDKEAMLARPEDAQEIPGVSIGSAGEDFVIEPFAAELTEAAS